MDSLSTLQIVTAGLCVAVGFSFASTAHAAKMFRGPVEAKVVDVLDGDTFLADALVWPGQFLRINIRIRGIDAPEMKSRCQTEHDAALLAREGLAEILGQEAIQISNIAGAKYYGRVLADVVAANGKEVAEEMILRSLVRPYDGGKRAGWCD